MMARGAGDMPCLHAAVISGNLEICYLLLKHGADVDAKDKHNRRALDLARGRENHQMVALLEGYVGRNTPETSEQQKKRKIEGITAEKELQVERSDRDREKREFEATIARLQQEKDSAEANLKKVELKNEELIMIVQRLEEEKAAAQSNVT